MKQQLKSRETKEKIFQAAKQILQKEGYEALSIKNICLQAQVSNGSFYHHFQSKDDLLSYYIEEQPKASDNLQLTPKDLAEVKEAILLVYLNYADYCKDLGRDFMSEYYSPKNQALNPETRSKRAYPIVTVREFVLNAKEAGFLGLDMDIEDFTTDIRMLIIGNVFEWCLRQGQADLVTNIRRSLGKYLDSVLYQV